MQKDYELKNLDERLSFHEILLSDKSEINFGLYLEYDNDMILHYLL